MREMIYPERRTVDDAWVVSWATDVATDGDYPEPEDVYQAMEILEDEGRATFTKSSHGGPVESAHD